MTKVKRKIRRVVLLPILSARYPAGKAAKMPPKGNMDPMTAASAGVNVKGVEAFVPFTGINWGNTGDVQASVDP